MARVHVMNETTYGESGPNDWTLWFQWCRYLYDNGTMEYGYRFIWKRPQADGGSLQAARGQARIPSVLALERLVAQARAEGWGEHDADIESLQLENIVLGNTQRDRILAGLPTDAELNARIASNSQMIADLIAQRGRPASI